MIRDGRVDRIILYCVCTRDPRVVTKQKRRGRTTHASYQTKLSMPRTRLLPTDNELCCSAHNAVL